MARRRRSGGRSGGFGINGTLKQAAFGAAAGMIAARFLPGNDAVVAPIAGYLVGKVPGAIGAVAVPTILAATGLGSGGSAGGQGGYSW